ncbi:MAG TPA: AAA family ATPase [Gemmataceae bacterium]|nr:AAA family ATPase [Gemmataceae bacterium]
MATNTEKVTTERLALTGATLPSWARDLSDLYTSGTTCLFVLHGNVHDLVRCPTEEGANYCNLSEFLARQIFGSWDLVLQYDLARGLRPLSGGDLERHRDMVQFLSKRLGDPASWPRDPDTLFLALDRLLERNLIEDDPKERKSIALMIEYAPYLIPAGDPAGLGRSSGTNLVRLLGWAQNPYIKRLNMAFCLVTDKLNEVNERLVQSPHVATIELPLPNREQRESFCRWSQGQGELEGATAIKPVELAQKSNGLSLVNLQVLLSQAKQSGKGVDGGRFREIKKVLIERQCQGLLEFIEPGYGLDLVVGQQAAKDRLRQDAELVTRGILDAAPMGYLLCGPVGTGKTFLAECYAGSIGVPCVKLRNFRSKYVGETEGNLEQVLTVLRSLGPVVVVIDEADAALGGRQSDGDSGTSGRVFSMIASQMGDTRYRGRIIWMLLTCRPDLLPIDLKRQGRAEAHLPLFYPQDETETLAMFQAMARKNKITLDVRALPPTKVDRALSGSDIESIVIAAKRRALIAGKSAVDQADLEAVAANFIPSTQGLEKELQEIAAVLECTEIAFLPPGWRTKVDQPDGRSRLQERFVAIQQMLRA